MDTQSNPTRPCYLSNLAQGLILTLHRKAPAPILTRARPPPAVSVYSPCNLHSVVASSSPVTSARGDTSSGPASVRILLHLPSPIGFQIVLSFPLTLFLLDLGEQLRLHRSREQGLQQGHFTKDTDPLISFGFGDKHVSSSSVVGALVAPVDSLEHSSSAIVAQAVKGSHMLLIDGYSLTKGLDNGKYIKSDKFSIGGYYWYIRYYPDGDGTENSGWISLYLQLHQENARSVDAIVKFSLLDNDGEPVPSYSRGGNGINTFNRKNPAWGIGDFIEKKALEESAYLKDDCFRVRCHLTVLKENCTEDDSQIVMVPPSDMTQHIGRLLSSGVETDVAFEVGGETYAAHRLVLGARSAVFMAELLGPMKERNRQIRIDDMDPWVFKDMLHFIYTDSLPEMRKRDTYAMATHLLVAADRFGLDRLKLMCENKLCNCINTSMVTTTLVLAEQHGCKGLKEACFKFLKSPGHLKKIMDSDEFQHLTSSCPSLLNELLANVAP